MSSRLEKFPFSGGGVSRPRTGGLTHPPGWKPSTASFAQQMLLFLTISYPLWEQTHSLQASFDNAFGKFITLLEQTGFSFWECSWFFWEFLLVSTLQNDRALFGGVFRTGLQISPHFPSRISVSKPGTEPWGSWKPVNFDFQTCPQKRRGIARKTPVGFCLQNREQITATLGSLKQQDSTPTPHPGDQTSEVKGSRGPAPSRGSRGGSFLPLPAPGGSRQPWASGRLPPISAFIFPWLLLCVWVSSLSLRGTLSLEGGPPLIQEDPLSDPSLHHICKDLLSKQTPFPRYRG